MTSESAGTYGTPNLPANIVGFRGSDSSIILILRGGIPMSIGSFPGKFESSNLSRRNVSRRIGRSTTHARLALLIVKVVACVHANTYRIIGVMLVGGLGVTRF